MAVTCPLAGLTVAFQALLTVCPPGSVNFTDQPLTALPPVLVTVMFSVRPVFQELTWVLTLHAAPLGGVDGEDEEDGDGEPAVPPSAVTAEL